MSTNNYQEGDAEQYSVTNFRSIPKLKLLQTTQSSLHLDGELGRMSSNPSSAVAKDINIDIKSLQGKSQAGIDEGVRVLTQVAIDTKQSFGNFPDQQLVAMATHQPDLSMKAKAFGVLDKPGEHTSLVSEVYEKLASQADNGDNVGLKAASHMAASLYAQSKGHPQLSAWSNSFGELVAQHSFAQAQPHYATKLALECNKNYLKTATDLTIMTRSPIHAINLLSHQNGWGSNDSEDKSAAYDNLTTVVVNAANLPQLQDLASNDTDTAIDKQMLSKLTDQALYSHFDVRLTNYLAGMSKPVDSESIKQLHVKLVRNAERLDTIPSQKALLELLEKQDSAGEVYNKQLLVRTIEEGERRYDVLRANNADKTLVEVTGAHIAVISKNEELDDKKIILGSLSNEQSLKSVLQLAFSESQSPSDDYDVYVDFNENATPFLREIISQQVTKSITGQPNDLDRILTQTVPMVSTRLDSRAYIQNRIQFEAAILNKNNTTEKIKVEHPLVTSNGLIRNNIQETRPKLTITNKTDEENSSVYNLTDFDSFDEAIIKIHRDNPGFSKDTHHTKIETVDANNYLKKQLKDDLEGYINKPSSKSMHNLNQHFTHTVTQLVDDRVKDNDTAYSIKTSIENNTDYHASSPKTKVSLT
ncbi:hypothetical protein [Psychrobacter sp. AOP31-A1-22]|uniref:hypothetical protein n=1 Tax=Psychrobacter sp. AOP31-A1-22 TaxID=3457696 RepID=UPI004035D9AE